VAMMGEVTPVMPEVTLATLAMPEGMLVAQAMEQAMEQATREMREQDLTRALAMLEVRVIRVIRAAQAAKEPEARLAVEPPEMWVETPETQATLAMELATSEATQVTPAILAVTEQATLAETQEILEAPPEMSVETRATREVQEMWEGTQVMLATPLATSEEMPATQAIRQEMWVETREIPPEMWEGMQATPQVT
jgi:hypothetical protein